MWKKKPQQNKTDLPPGIFFADENGEPYAWFAIDSQLGKTLVEHFRQVTTKKEEE